MVQARIVPWGNSRGLRIPKPLLEQAGIQDEVTIEARNGELVIRPAAAHPRAGWADSYAAMAAAGHAQPFWPDDLEDRFDDDLPPW